MSSARDASLDAVKGVLVLLMAVYHVMSIATTAPTEAYEPVRFVTGSFVFCAGFVVSQFHLAADRASTSRQLVARGAKLLLLFTALNLGVMFAGLGKSVAGKTGLEAFVAHLPATYLGGDPSVASFVILLSIGYLLLAVPLVLALCAGSRAHAWATLAAALAASAVPAGADRWPNLQYLLVGISGLCVGLLVRLQPAPRLSASGMAFALAALGAAAWLTGHLGNDNAALYAIGVVLVLWCLRRVVGSLTPELAPSRFAVLLGRYSLPCYLAQILIIQALFRTTSTQRWSDLSRPIAAFAATVAIMLLMCKLLDRLRLRSRIIDRSYRLVFS
jgi:peptidoglycan/LPS O-acetylase OafA/YrhL